MNMNTLDQRPSLPSSPTPAPPPMGQTGSSTGIDTVSEVKQEEVSPMRQATNELRQSGADTLESAKAAGVGFLAEQKTKLASCIDDYKDDLHTASVGLKKEEKSALAAPAEKAATQLQRAADYLRDKEPIDMYHDLENFARRRPEIAYGALFFAGLVAVRFLKASARHPQSA